jgi:hypothetical protein
MRIAVFATVAIMAMGVPALAGAAVVGQTDRFESGTTEGWFAGGGPFEQVPPVPPQVVGTGGPGGAGDGYLRVTAQGGSGPGSRLVAMNGAQWAGNYSGQRLGAIGMDLLNSGTTDLTIRLLFEDPMGGPPANLAVTSFGATLPAGSGWTHVTFPITAADLMAIEGTALGALSGTTLLRIIHSPLAEVAVPVVGTLGIDNITVTPAPAGLVLAATGFLALAAGKRRRRRD